MIAIVNAGVRTASEGVIDRLAKDEEVDQALYYFSTSPGLIVAPCQDKWMRRSTLVAHGIRKPGHAVADSQHFD